MALLVPNDKLERFVSETKIIPVFQNNLTYHCFFMVKMFAAAATFGADGVISTDSEKMLRPNFVK